MGNILTQAPFFRAQEQNIPPPGTMTQLSSFIRETVYVAEEIIARERGRCKTKLVQGKTLI